MLNFFRIASAGLFLAGNLVFAATETTSSSSTLEINSVESRNGVIDNELHSIDIDAQSRRKNWDVFGVLLMSTLFTVEQ